MKYKVGDKVRVRKDLHRGTEYNDWLVVDAMMKYRGMTVTIAKIDFDHYHIKEDNAPILCEPITCSEDLEKKYPGVWLEVVE